MFTVACERKRLAACNGYAGGFAEIDGTDAQTFFTKTGSRIFAGNKRAADLDVLVLALDDDIRHFDGFADLFEILKRGLVDSALVVQITEHGHLGIGEQLVGALGVVKVEERIGEGERGTGIEGHILAEESFGGRVRAFGVKARLEDLGGGGLERAAHRDGAANSITRGVLITRLVSGNGGKRRECERTAFGNGDFVLDVPFGIHRHLTAIDLDRTVVLVKIAVDDELAGTFLLDKGVLAAVVGGIGVRDGRGDAVGVVGGDRRHRSSELRRTRR